MDEQLAGEEKEEESGLSNSQMNYADYLTRRHSKSVGMNDPKFQPIPPVANYQPTGIDSLSVEVPPVFDTYDQLRSKPQAEGLLSKWLQEGYINPKNALFKMVGLHEKVANAVPGSLPGFKDWATEPLVEGVNKMLPGMGMAHSYDEGTGEIAQTYEPLREKIEENPLASIRDNTVGSIGGALGSGGLLRGASELTSTLQEFLKGKGTVAKQYVEDLLRMPGLKKPEIQAAQNILKDAGATMDAGQFVEKLKESYLPLKRVDAGRQYKGTNLQPHKQEPGIYSETIYESPIKNSAGEKHFERGPLKAPEGYFAHTRRQDLLNVDEPDRFVKPMVSKEVAKKYGVTSGNTRRILEVQSDLFQKGRLDEEFKEPFDTVRGQLENNPTLDMKRWKNADKEIKEMGKADESYGKLKPFENQWHTRTIREEIRQAAVDGKRKIQLPVGNTAMDIEGLSGKTKWMGYDPETTNTFDLNEMKVGMPISRDIDGGENWMVTEVIDGNKFKAINDPSVLDDAQRTVGKLPRNYDSMSITKQIQYLKDNHPEYLKKFEEAFDKTGSNESHGVYKFYENEIPKSLKKIKGTEPRRIKDSKDNEWWEIDIDPEDAKKPILNLGKRRQEALTANA